MKNAINKKRYKLRLLGGGLGFSLLMVAINSAGFDEREDSLLSLSLKELAQIEVTSSTLTRKNNLTVPASVSVFTRRQIRNMGAEYLFELINFVPGFQTFRRGADSLQYFHSSRGYRTSVKSREILILIDGVRYIREADNGASIPMLSLYNVEKIEFIRGPGSALYGSNAFSGVINIETIKDENSIQVAAGELGRKQFNSVFSHSANDLDVNLAVNVFDERGENFRLQNINTEPQQTLTAKDPRMGRDLQVSVSKGDYQIKGLLSRRQAEDFYIVERAAPDINRSIHDSANFTLSRQFRWSESFESNVEIGYSENAFKLDTEIQGLGVTQTDQQEHTWGFQVRNAWQYAQQNSVEFGIEQRNSDISSVYNSEILGDLRFYPNHTRRVTGVYLQHQRYYHGGLQVVLGGRYDNYNDVGSAFSPRFSLVYPLNEHQSIKALYGEAFRAPGANELYLIGVTLSGNPNLKPETIATSELIWTGQWDKHNFSINGHYNVVEDAIFSTSIFENQKSDESSWGVELSYDYQPTKNWLFRLNATTLEGLPSADFRQADKLASLIVNYQAKSWNINVNASFAGQRDYLFGTEQRTINSYWLTNSKVTYSINNKTNLYINGRNIFNTHYGTPTRLTAHAQAIPNRGRELVLGLEVSL